ncbi:hypothetical protein DFP72DRAFT_1012787 [Ephemerocybe angulata]|uniref:SPIN90/Ldb17 leucine-rich domain-containing protein n=1 Tax=Ephemerocybe angulata TaxID=980116 RepID=A0A8H6HQ73_9AGAR|nr:hypothetical protein DFP72DRAFT_1012787 [Tulosesus angulatus]
MVHRSAPPIPSLVMEDDLGIVYVIETAQQFWSELEDALSTLGNDGPTLDQLDSTLKRFLTLCATYHEQYLQSPLQLEHAISMVLDSELFQFHSSRMCDIMVDDARKATDPHLLFIHFNTLYFHGHRRADAFRNHKRWQPIMPLLMDHILVEIDPDVEDTFFGGAGNRHSVVHVSVPVPIEVKLRSLSVKLLYEVCKVQKLSAQDLKIFEDDFIDFLFDLVEQTRYMHDETFNYSVIKLIVGLNEQFMVAGLGSDPHAKPEEPSNRVVRVLMRRLGMSKTFGENMIFMLNRAKHTPEDLCMQLLILKLLYVLFTTKGMSEYFYTNDLCVLVDVFIRELADLGDEHESLRHTFLRVLHPLLTKTQLRDIPYKRAQIMVQLESLIAHASIHDVNPTTKRLVERCLSGDWCVQLKATQRTSPNPTTPASPGSDFSSVHSPPTHYAAPASLGLDSSISRLKNLKFSKSVENLGFRPDYSKAPPIPRSPLDQVRHPNGSTASLASLPSSKARPTSPPVPRKRTNTYDSSSSIFSGSSSGSSSPTSVASGQQAANLPLPTPRPTSSSLSLPGPLSEEPTQDQPRVRRPPPPAPPKRRKPPAVPLLHNRNVTIHPIRSSEPSPLSRVVKPPPVS